MFQFFTINGLTFNQLSKLTATTMTSGFNVLETSSPRSVPLDKSDGGKCLIQ